MSYTSIKTIGELKEAIKDIPDDVKIIRYESTMEKSGFFYKNYLDTTPKRYREVRKDTCDRFDRGSYTYTCLEQDDNGDILAINF